MSSENFDTTIKESLEQGSPAFKESSWHKMETILDKHMPQKKDDRRKLIIFLFTFLLLGGGTTFIVNRNFSVNKVTQNSFPTVRAISQEKENPLNSTRSAGKIESVSSPLDEKNNSSITTLNPPTNNSRAIVVKNKTPKISANTKLKTTEKNIIKKKETNSPLHINDQEKRIPEIKSAAAENISTAQQKLINATEIIEPENKKTEPEVKKEDLNEMINPAENIKKSYKKKQSFFKNILINLSAGPDINSVGTNTAKINMTFGAGLGYKISDRLTIRTGLFIGRKTYSADPGDYNPPANFWTYYPNIKTIDADCKVLEIPLNFDYKFGFSKKQNWFVSAGTSSYIMKKEEYNYYFKPTYSSQYIYYSSTFENKNKHYFSILNLSGGLSRKISPVLTLQAEPYLKIALMGIGYGKVKLNSAGLLFTASILPFQSKK